MKPPILQRLPLGRSAFSAIRQDDCLYVDKTEHAYNLITQGYRYFLSRPRRFGKSLLVSTLQEILEANKPLFKDLWIEKSDYQWHKHGVITLDFSAIMVTNVEILRNRLCELLQNNANRYQLGVTLHATQPDSALEELVLAFHAKFGYVAVLVDGYDSPILRHLGVPEQVNEIRDIIRTFFATIKSLDVSINFVFITGVSSFSKAGLFSGMNNLKTITLDKQYATICGYTEQEIDYYFASYIQTWANKQNVAYDSLRSQIKNWYNGYQFATEAMRVYNPYSVMSALDIQEFENFWFATGTPTFLVKELEKKYRGLELKMFNLKDLATTKNDLGVAEIGETPLATLMFQTGYLTITGFDQERNLYLLGYPNHEVSTATQKRLLGLYTRMQTNEIGKFAADLFYALNQKDIPEIVKLIKSIFVRVAYQEHIKEEGFYHGLLQVLLGAAGINATSELSTSHGRIDMVIELPKLMYAIELKFNKTAQKALKQIEERKYYEALTHHNKPIVLLGLNFHRKPKDFDVTYASLDLQDKT